MGETKETVKREGKMRYVWLAAVLTLTGCAAPTTYNHRWYEIPGIAIGGATVGVLIGPEVVAIQEADRRMQRAGKRFSDVEMHYGVGWLLHVGTTVGLFLAAPPVGWGYIAMSAIVGGVQFSENDGWDTK